MGLPTCHGMRPGLFPSTPAVSVKQAYTECEHHFHRPCVVKVSLFK